MSVSSGLSSAPQLPLTPNGEQAAAASSAEHRNGLGGASFGGGGGSRRHHSRMLSVDSLAEISKPQKVVPMVRHVFSEGFLLFRLAIILYSYLGMGACVGQTGRLGWLAGKWRHPRRRARGSEAPGS